jgi:hypothetical protein
MLFHQHSLIIHILKPTRPGHEKENQDRRGCRLADPVRDGDDRQSGACDGKLSDVAPYVADDPCLADFGHCRIHQWDLVHCYPGKKEALRPSEFALLHPIRISIIPRVQTGICSDLRSIRSFFASLFHSGYTEGMLALNTQQTSSSFPESSDVPGKF